jgi:hypothetical protein
MERIILKQEHTLSSGRVLQKGESHYVDRETKKRLIKQGIARDPNVVEKLTAKKTAKEKGVYNYKKDAEDATDKS